MMNNEMLAVALKSAMDVVLNFDEEEENNNELVAAAAICLSTTSNALNAALAVTEERQTHPRVRNYCEGVVPEYDPADYHRRFRMTPSTFDALLIKVIERNPSFNNTNYPGGVRPISAKKKLQIGLRYLCTKQPMVDLADVFHVTESTIFKVRNEVIQALCALKNDLIRWPTAAEAEKVAADFKDISQFPGIIGAIDGSYIPARFRKELGHDYINRKKFKAVTLQATCTSKKIITHIYAGASSRIHDARVLKLSKIWNIVQRRGKNYLFYNDNYHLIGDGAYGLKSWLLRPYKGPRANLTPSQLNYNKRLSRCRVRVEHLFGLMKGRWQRLNYINTLKLPNIAKIVTACAVLHNFCYLRDDIMPHLLRREPRVEQNDDHLENPNEEEYAEAVAKMENIRQQLPHN